MLTTAEAAALLSERGITGKDGGRVRSATVQQWCKRGRFPGARSIGGRVWLIPQGDLDAFVPHRPGRPAANAGKE